MLRGNNPATCAAVVGLRDSRVCCAFCDALLELKLPGPARRSWPAAAARAVAAEAGVSGAAGGMNRH